MTLVIRFSSNAELDFLRAQAYYDHIAPHQTDRFISEVFAATRVLVQHHEIGRMVGAGVRRWHLEVFPYQRWYRLDPTAATLRVIAVVGDSQDHSRFTGRLTP